eukprot:328591-Chlamydomonas_euryale.AAC.5
MRRGAAEVPAAFHFLGCRVGTGERLPLLPPPTPQPPFSPLPLAGAGSKAFPAFVGDDPTPNPTKFNAGAPSVWVQCN